MEDSAAEGGGQRVVKLGFMMISLDVRRSCSAACQLKVEARYDWTERPLRIIQVTRLDGHAAVLAEAVEALRMTNMYTATVCMDRSVLSVTKAVLNYAGSSELQYGV